MIEAGIQSGDYVILKKSQTAENGDMCAVWIDSKEATLKWGYGWKQPTQGSRQD
jgi:repressor LexA